MTKKITISIAALVLFGTLSPSHVRAQNSNSMDGMAMTNAPDTAAAAVAASGSKPDPAGTATGVASDVPGFIVNAPSELSADDKKDADKVKAYTDAKKAADDYAA